jgi:hypothetical protein
LLCRGVHVLSGSAHADGGCPGRRGTSVTAIPV